MTRRISPHLATLLLVALELGESQAAIARRLGLSVSYVRRLVDEVCERLGVRDRRAPVARARELRLLDPEDG